MNLSLSASCLSGILDGIGLRKWRAVSIVLLTMLACPGFAQNEWKPSRNVEIIVQAGAGGASDRTARMMQRIIQTGQLVETSTTVLNKAGGGGALAYNYINQHSGDGHFWLVTSGTLLTSYLSGQSPFPHTDFTPLAILFTEYAAFAVREDSPIKTGKDLLSRLKGDSPLSIAISPGLGNANHIAMAMAVKAAGGDVKKLKIVVFNSSPETMTALLGGHVDVAISPASPMLPFITSGKARAIAVSSAQRLGGALANVPTWKEQGVDAVFGNWRGVLGPKGMSDAQIAYWSRVFARLAASPEWKDDLDKNLLTPFFMDGKESKKYMDNEYKQVATIMKDIGLAK
ncbi:MAG: tripartite tricarboxylate transporter substrate binding protein [Burkholderiales bacterium]